MKLPAAPPAYDQTDQAQMRREMLTADKENLKRQSSETYILMSKPDGTVGKLTINAGGTPIWTAL
jgi:hypothetical protein